MRGRARATGRGVAAGQRLTTAHGGDSGSRKHELLVFQGKPIAKIFLEQISVYKLMNPLNALK